MKIPGKCSTLAFCAGLGASLVSGIAFAQDTEGAAVEEIVVTGSRIRSADLTSPSPLQVVDAQLIEDLGVVNVQDALQLNPAFGVPGQSRFISNNSITNAGSATVNLRNLGANRTLVLVDGRRMIAGIPGTTQVDLSMVPTEFIERVEVLTGGASAVYGSDAVAGVVNLIYKKDFEGFVANAQMGVSQEGDGDENKVSLLAGSNFADGAGNFMVTMAYSDQKALEGDKRSFSDDSYFSMGVQNGNSSDLFKRVLNRSTVHPSGTMAAGGQNYTFDANGDAIPWDINDQSTRYNQNDFGPTRNIASPVERLSTAARLSYEMSDSVTGIFELNYGRTSSVSSFEPHPYVSNSNIIGIFEPHNLENFITNPADGTTLLVRNPYIPDILYNGNTDSNGDGLIDAPYSKRMVEFGNRATDIDRQLFRVVFGFEGDISDNWSYDAYYSYGRSDLAGRMQGLFNIPNLRAALNVTSDVFDFDGDGDVAEAVCVDPNARARGCVPINFYGLNNITDEAKAYVQGTGFQDSVQEMNVISANVTGTLFEMPAGPMQVAAGIEYRDESSKHRFDPLSNTNQNGFIQLTDTLGSQTVKEVYAEVNVPIINSLSIRAAGRMSDYSTLDKFNAYNVGLEWAPIDSLRFRAVYASAVRAPNIGELFAAPNAGVTSITDPCQGVAIGDTDAVALNCLADPGVVTNANANGGVVTFIQSDFQGVQTISANNPNIAEETGETKTFGVVFQPEFLPGLALTVDYYDIELEDAINRVSTSTVLNKCYTEGLQEFCDFVSRRTAAATPYSAGSVDLLVRGLVNSGGLFSEGVDVTANYVWDVGEGSMSINATWTHLLDQGIYPLTGDPVDTFEGEIGFPTDKAFVSFRWDRGPFRLSMSGEYVGASYIDDDWVNNNFPTENPRSGNFEISSKFYMAGQVGYTFSDTYDVYFGVNNLLDSDPPPIWGGIPGGSGNANTNQGRYDVVGRSYYVGVRASF